MEWCFTRMVRAIFMRKLASADHLPTLGGRPAFDRYGTPFTYHLNMGCPSCDVLKVFEENR